MNRRNFLRLGIGAAIAAPALVSRANIMAIKVPRPDIETISGLQMLIEAQTRRDQLLRMEIGEIDRFTIYVDHAAGPDMSAVWRLTDAGFEVVDLGASNYGRGPGQLRENALGMRSWTPPAPTAIEIQAKRAEGWRQMRRWLEPNRSKRWV